MGILGIDEGNFRFSFRSLHHSNLYIGSKYLTAIFSTHTRTYSLPLSLSSLITTTHTNHHLDASGPRVFVFCMISL